MGNGELNVLISSKEYSKMQIQVAKLKEMERLCERFKQKCVLLGKSNAKLEVKLDAKQKENEELQRVNAILQTFIREKLGVTSINQQEEEINLKKMAFFINEEQEKRITHQICESIRKKLNKIDKEYKGEKNEKKIK